jgi:hypothetical protein
LNVSIGMLLIEGEPASRVDHDRRTRVKDRRF